MNREIEEIKGRYKDKHQQYNSPVRMWDDMQIVLFHISILEEKVKLAEATREDALAYAKGYKNGQMQLQQRVKELEAERKRYAIDGQCALDEANNRIKELQDQLRAIKDDPSIGKLIVEDWPESPDY